jgi:hypothetical protein
VFTVLPDNAISGTSARGERLNKAFIYNYLQDWAEPAQKAIEFVRNIARNPPAGQVVSVCAPRTLGGVFQLNLEIPDVYF